jgi:hypothetical protein
MAAVAAKLAAVRETTITRRPGIRWRQPAKYPWRSPTSSTARVNTVLKMFVPISELSWLLDEAADGRKQAYCGKNLGAPPRPWSAAEKAKFDPETTLAAVSTPEVAINPIALAQILRGIYRRRSAYRT